MVSVLFLMGPLMMIGTYFQAIGSAARAAISGLSKPYLFAIPMTLILPNWFGEPGIWFAGPSAEILLLGLTTLGLGIPSAQADEAGGYGRFQGDVGLSLEAGLSESFGGESLALRGSVFYLSTVGLVAQYNDSLGLHEQSLQRSFMGGVELRPLFMGRFAQNMEYGPAHLDLLLDSIGIGLGLYRQWALPDHGMEVSLGLELPFLPQANAPFVALRGAMRWSLQARTATVDPPAPTGMLTLSIGYHHLFATHAVDAADVLAR